jgi:hypothetical protein
MKFQSVLFGRLVDPSTLAVQVAVEAIRGFAWANDTMPDVPVRLAESLGNNINAFALYRFQKLAVLGAIIAAISMTAFADNPAATVNVNANANRHPISPLIYGANWADQSKLSDLNLTVNRRGGNATTTYNWKTNATNRGADWYFESLSDGPGVPSDSANQFINATKAGGADAMITIPLVDWVATLGPSRSGLAAYSTNKYGPQTGSDPWWSAAGNGIGTNAVTGTTWTIRTNDPSDAFVPNSPAFQQQWVQYLTNKYGVSSSGGVKYYLMDNEHGVWPWTHRPIVPVGPTMDNIRDRMLAYGGVVKAVDPNAMIVGPEEWGWPNYFKSPSDTFTGTDTDRNNHGGWDYMPWLLNQFKLTNNATGQRLLDIFSLHYYPQYSEFDQGDSSIAAQLKRNETTRDLWDTSYVSTSWIGASVQLIPRMKSWVNAYYPGTKIAITEYNWGAEGHISGAIAEADVLGIFGREGLDLATFWGNLDSTAPIYKAFKMYRNYDGNKSTFGDTSVSATVANPDNVSAFAAQRSTNGTLTVMVICKYLTNNTPITVNLGNFIPGATAQVWQLTSANTINHLADAAVSSGSLSFSAPVQSITLFVIPGTNTPPASLQALYAFEGNAQDSSGSVNHGTATSVSYVAGKVGSQAAQFNGTSSYVLIPRSVQDDFTVAMWVKTTDTAGSAGAQWWNGKGLVDGEVGGGGADWGTAIVNGKFVLGVGSASGDTTLASSVNINDGTWHHVAATRDNSSGAMQVFVDGVLRGSGTGPTGSRTWPPNLHLGNLQTGNNFLNGTLDEVRLYDRILSANEIAGLVAAPAAPTNLVATVGDASVALSWSAPSNATSYFVKRSIVSGAGYAAIATNTSLTFTNTGLTNGTLYYFVVSASDPFGESPNSAPVSARPTASTPVAMNATNASGQLQISWPADHTGWQLQAQTNSLGTNWVNLAGSTQTNQVPAVDAANGAVFFRLVRPY